MAKIKVTQESETGRNLQFAKGNGHKLSRAQLVQEIKCGKHDHMHVRVINGIETPATNPDKSTKNNLG